MLSFAAGSALAGYLGTRALPTVNTAGLPRRPDRLPLGMDVNIVLFTIVLSLVTGILFGSIPAPSRRAPT
jgi:hypothetical protein